MWLALHAYVSSRPSQGTHLFSSELIYSIPKSLFDRGYFASSDCYPLGKLISESENSVCDAHNLISKFTVHKNVVFPGRLLDFLQVH